MTGRLINKITVGKRKLPVLYKVTVENIGAKGKVIARVDNFVTFIKNSLPGDVVDLQVTKKRKSYQEARVIAFHQYSEQRTEPFCAHFKTCGGCKWQDLKYESQLNYKQQEVVDSLKRLGRIDIPVTRSILPSEDERYYRNKLEYTFSNKRWLSNEEINTAGDIEKRNGLGFHIPGMFDKVVDIRHCYLQPEPSNSIRNAVRKYALENNLSFYDLKQQQGLLRNLIIRTTLSGESMVIVVFHENNTPAIGALMEYLKITFPAITSLNYIINLKANDTISDQEVVNCSGKDYIVEKMEDLQFKIGPKSFFQTNSRQALRLYGKVREYAGLSGTEILYDLYTGTGTIANFLASGAKKVVGMEYIEEAIEDAKENSVINGIKNTSFFSGDIKELLTREFISREGHPDVIVTDPPRAGMHKNVVDAILFASPRRIVYVSCNPATQARDIQLLGGEYKVLEIQPVDMFPHTYHVENIALLERISQ